MGSTSAMMRVYEQQQELLSDASAECRVRDEVSQFEAETLLFEWFLKNTRERMRRMKDYIAHLEGLVPGIEVEDHRKEFGIPVEGWD